MSKKQQTSGELKQLEDTKATLEAHIKARQERGLEESESEKNALAEVTARIDQLKANPASVKTTPGK